MNATLLCLALAAGQGMDEKTAARLQAEIVPPAAELRWLRVPWHVTLWDAVVAAQKEDRPVLFYAMNGHPLAVC